MSEYRPPEPKPSFWNLFIKADDSTLNPNLAPVPYSGPQVPSVPPAPAPAPEPTDRPDTTGSRAIFWSMQHLPEIEAPQHFLVCGTVGSGKTIAIRLLLQSIAPRFRAGWDQPEQLILFDAKVDAIPQLAALGLAPEDERVWILNPHDRRSAVWNVAEAVTDPLMARHFATLLVPEERQSNAPYFTEAARELVIAAILALNYVAGFGWTLRDLLCALDCRDHIEKVTSRMPRAKVLAQRILHDDRHSSGVLSTLGTKLGRFEQVAALWHSNKQARRFSVPEFLRQPGILILGNDPLLRESFWPINAMLLRTLSQHILRGPNVMRPRHWFILDEFRAMERVDCIHDLLNRGRSKGASVLLGIQSIVGLMDIYGRYSANDLLSACSYKTFLRVGDPETAEWAEKLFGKVRRTEEVRSESTGRGGHNTNIQYQVQERSLFIASYFLSLPFPRLGGPYRAVADIACQNRTLVIDLPFDEVLSWCVPPSDVPALEPFGTPADQVLQPWTEEEECQFTHGDKHDSPEARSAPQESAASQDQPAPAAPKPKPDGMAATSESDRPFSLPREDAQGSSGGRLPEF